MDRIIVVRETFEQIEINPDQLGTITAAGEYTDQGGTTYRLRVNVPMQDTPYTSDYGVRFMGVDGVKVNLAADFAFPRRVVGFLLDPNEAGTHRILALCICPDWADYEVVDPHREPNLTWLRATLSIVPESGRGHFGQLVIQREGRLLIVQILPVVDLPFMQEAS